MTRFVGPPVMLKGNMAMNAQELRDKTPDQLRDQLLVLKKEAFNLRFQQATGPVSYTHLTLPTNREV